MKKTNLLIALMLLLSATVSSWAAERVAPTLPEFATLEAGNEYNLYNVGYDGFWTNRGSNYIPYVSKTDHDYISKLKVIAATDSTYYIKNVEFNTYYRGYSSSPYYLENSSYVYNSSIFHIADSLGGYTIQLSPEWTSDSTLYLGTVVDDDNICWNATENNIVWQFMDTEKAERYNALYNLYTALEATDGTGFNVDKFEAIYANEASTNEELTAAATTLNDALSFSTKVMNGMDTDIPILLNKSGFTWIHNNGYIYGYDANDANYVTLTGTVTVDSDATLCYEPWGSCGIKVYIDDVLVRDIPYYLNTNSYSSYNNAFSEKLTAGTHTIKWVSTSKTSTMYFDRIFVERTPTIEVSLLEPGSLGTEVLYNVDHIKDVRRLKIKGEMNSDDWLKIDMMTRLYSLDLSEAKITSIPKSQFYGCYYPHEIILPEGLTEIENSAFSTCNVASINFPSTLKRIGENAFYRSLLKEAILPDSVTSLGSSAFQYSYALKKVNLPKGLTSIPAYCFDACHSLETPTFHEGLVSIGYQAFYNNYTINPRFPKSLKTISDFAFYNCDVDSVTTEAGLGNYAFAKCSELVYVERPTTYTYAYPEFTDCVNLKTVVFKSPTVVRNGSNNFFSGCTASGKTIKVPSFLVNAYKLDEYWYNYNIEGFSTADVKDWVISRPLVLNARERFEGKPNLTISGSGSLKINGEDEMTIDSLTIDGGIKLLSNCDNISIDGKLTHNYYTSANYWYFVSMPFDFIVGEITASNNAKYAIRYYDGAARAANGIGGSWKNFAATDTVKAGTGFILRTSVDSYVTFTSLENESKQYVVSNEEFVKALDANVSETASNRGWNLVGNPWQAYYNIHILNFTAPITTWSVTNKTYSAYSIIDDDYAISPNQAFFVQCPDEVVSMSFPVGGRQLTSEITTQQGTTTQARELGIIDRQLVDIALASNGLTDKTRIVFNDAAAMAYEPACDASKFFTMESGVSQVYTIDSEGNNYSINERPETDGVVKVGVMIAASGKHTFSLQRNKAESVVLVDQVTGVSHDLMASDYEFTAEAGTYNDRFVLNIKKAPGTTGIDNAAADNVSVTAVEGGIEIAGALGTVNVYSVDGRLAATIEADGTAATVSLDNGVYIVKAANKTAKVVVK